MREAKEIWAEQKMLDATYGSPRSQQGPNRATREEARKVRNKRKKVRLRRGGR
jgi:hypothetical protein